MASKRSPATLRALARTGAPLVTQILSDTATLVLLGPMALALALGLPPQPFIVAGVWEGDHRIPD